MQIMQPKDDCYTAKISNKPIIIVNICAVIFDEYFTFHFLLISCRILILGKYKENSAQLELMFGLVELIRYERYGRAV